MVPKSCWKVSGIEPGLSLQARSALMSPIVSNDPFFSRQIAYFAPGYGALPFIVAASATCATPTSTTAESKPPTR
jgi:hypothetical protein